MSNSAQQPNRPRVGGPAPFEGAPANALPLTATQDRQTATLAHFGGILGFLPSLLLLLVFKDRGPFTAQEAREALNFTLPPTLVALVAWVLSLVPAIGAVFAVVNATIWLGLTIFSVYAGIQASKGRPYRYPLNLRLLR